MEAGAYGNLWQTSFSATTESIHRTKMILTSKFYVKSLSFRSSMNLHVKNSVSKSLSGRGKILKVIANVQGAPNIINGSKVKDKELIHTARTNGIAVELAEEEDVFRLGRLVQGNLVYRQKFSIRSYEVGADMSGSIETMMNHLQETALNHVCVAGMNGDGFGSTHEMTRLNLIWVVTRMQVHVERYPSWGDVVEIDTWVAGSGKNSLRRDWLVRDYKTGYILAQATSTWVMMNRNTRKLSKFPEAVKNEISPYYLERTVIDQSHHEKLEKLGDDTAQYIHSNLTPRWTDLDVNRHVNNVKYIGWILESVPVSILENQQLAKMTLEYRRECEQSHVLQSMTSLEKNSGDFIDPISAPSHSCTTGSLRKCKTLCRHLLRLQENGAEIVRGSTEWRAKPNRN